MKKLLILLLLPLLVHAQSGRIAGYGAAGSQPTGGGISQATLDSTIARALTNGGIVGVTTSLSLASDLRIFHVTPTAAPGSAIFVQGHFPATAVLGLMLPDGVSYTLPAIGNQQAGAISSVLPALLKPGMFTLFVSYQGGKSPNAYINRAEGYAFDSPDVYSGATMSILGTNLSSPVSAPTVRLVSLTSAVSLSATTISAGASDKRLIFTAPLSLTTGQKYIAYVSNGMGGTAGEVVVDDTLTAIATTATSASAITATSGALLAGVDPYGLGVAHGARFGPYASNVYNVKTDARLTTKAVGNGTTNDLVAVQYAMVAADNTGGTIWFPPGSYNCTGSANPFNGTVGLYMTNNTVLLAAPGSVTITYGGNGTNKFFYEDNTRFRNGISGITFVNVDNSATSMAPMLLYGSEFFMKNVTWEIKQGDQFEFVGSKQITIQDCNLSQGLNSLRHPIIGASGSKYFNLQRNTLTGTYGLSFPYAEKLFYENNTLIRDVARGRGGNTEAVHLLVIDYAKKSYVGSSRFLVANGPIPPVNTSTLLPNDGESIIAESVGAPDISVGTVTSAGANTLTDNTKSWSTTFTGQPYVYIIAGRGMGQIRRIASRTATVLSLYRNWDIVPDATSKYSIDQCFRENNIVGNYFQDQQRGITLYYSAGHENNVELNTLINSGSIDLDPVQGTQGGGTQFAPMWSYRIANNRLDATTDPDNGTFIGVHAVQHGNQTGATLGTLALGIQMVGNTVVASSPNKDAIVDDRYANGILSYHEYQAGSGYVPGVPVVLGSTIQNNTVINANAGVYVNAGSYLTMLKANNFLSVPTLINENTKVTGTSVKTTTY